MSVDRPIAARYPILARALERHLAWARDFAVAGDFDLAVDAIRDARATLGELHGSDAPHALRLAYETLEDDAGSGA